MLNKIYQKFLKEYKPQLWWPTTPKNKLKPEYLGGPSNEKEKFEIILGAILTQNTSWVNVEKAIINLNKHNILNINSLNSINIKKLKLLIKPAGYYNQKSERLKLIAKFLNNNPITKLEKLNIKKLRPLLLKQKGIGPETADSILLYALNKPVFVIDTYTKRIFSRIGFLEEKSTYEEWQKLFHKNLKEDLKQFQEYHALIVEHAKRYCKKKPLCNICILKENCKNAKNHLTF
ncbi:MAG: endonuclease [Nanoarchaeota archaeon]|nr:endonuclease [Nanoarchaeota archaeon]